MNSNKHIIRAGIAGTACMTLFSYLISKQKNRNFKEPQLLGQLIKGTIPISKKQSQIAGWLLHFGIGVSFAVLYSIVINKAHIKPYVTSGLIAGGISGIGAIAMWDAVFELHTHPPLKHFKKYYGHLMATHFVFGGVTFFCL